MNRRSTVLVASLTLIILSVAFITAYADDSSASTAYDVRVFVETGEGSYAETLVDGSSVRQVIEQACVDLELPIEYDEWGGIESVGHLGAEAPVRWNIHQWMPMGVYDWSSVGYDEIGDSKLITGTSYCLHRSGQEIVNASLVYGKPDFRPESDGYVFIRFDTEYDSMKPGVQNAFTTEDRINGFWIKGHGSNMGEVVLDAMETNDFIMEYFIGGDGNGNDLQYWLDSFFGIDGSTNLGSSTSWAYWSQYMYLDDSWTYNQKTLGYYDPAVYKYVAIVYIVSIDYADGAGEEQNVLLTLPPIIDEEFVNSLVKYSLQDVEFYLDGELVTTEKARLGSSIPRELFPDVPEKEGMTFDGWGYDGSVVEGPVALYGTYSDRYYDVAYQDISGTQVFAERVKHGDPATHTGIPQVPNPGKYRYDFQGWSSDGVAPDDLSSVKKDLVLLPLYEKILITHTVSFILDGMEIDRITVDHGSVLAQEQIPVPEVAEGQYFTGWGDIASVILEDKVFSGTVEDLEGYLVTYLDANGATFYQESVYSGSPATFGNIPVKDSTAELTFTFRCWMEEDSMADLSSVTRNMTVHPSYDPVTRQYTVSFILDGEIQKTMKCDYGTVLAETDIPNPEVPRNKKFTGWGDIAAPITNDTVFNGSVYIPPKCVISYYNSDGQQFRQDRVDYGGAVLDAPSAGKTPDQQYTYRFDYWSTDGNGPADLSCITSDLALTPVFVKIPQVYCVTFYAQNGTVVAERYAEYGQAISDIPEGPERADTIDKVYTFAGWYIALFVDIRSDSGLMADLSCITSSKVVYAAYTYVPHPYALKIIVDDGTVIDKVIKYGDYLSESLMMDTYEGHLLKYYRDDSHNALIDSSFMFTGDRTLYAVRMPGTYSHSEENQSTICVKLDPATSDNLPFEGNTVTVCDISAFPGGKNVRLHASDLKILSDTGVGRSNIVFAKVLLPRGSISVSISDILHYCGDDPDAQIEFSIGKGPSTSVRLNSALKKINWDETFTVTLTIDGYTISDLAAENIRVRVGLPFKDTQSDSVTPMLWSADKNTGALTSVDCVSGNGTLDFEASILRYFVTGTSAPRESTTNDYDPCPYGNVDYTCRGEVESNYNSTLNRMDLDNRGNILFVPSSLEGYALWSIGPEAFAGVRNAPTIVIPDSVRTFDWSSVTTCGASNIYFLGDKPEFTGDYPESVTVHYSVRASGWNESGFEPLPISLYGHGSTWFYYCLIDEQIIIVKHHSGIDVDIPARIGAGEDGADYPVTTIACNAFEGSNIVAIRLPSTIETVQTRAFYKCASLSEVTWAPGHTVTVLADECFRYCGNLLSNSLLIPDTVKFIGFEAFRGDHMIRTVSIPDSVIDIRGGAFYDCIQLANLKIGKGITAIPERGFAFCNSLDGVVLPDNVVTLDPLAFYCCPMLTSIDLNKVKSLGGSAFENCTSLGTAVFGKDLESLGRNSFSNCNVLKNVSAYCTQPIGFESCGIDSNTSVMTDASVSAGWSSNHEVIPEDDLKRSFESRTMPFVIAGLIVFFCISAIASWRIKQKMY